MASALRLIGLALKFHWDAQRSNLPNLIAGTVGMITNNLIILWGLWAMLFDGKPNSLELTIYFLALNAMVTISWGCICFFFGGIRSLGEFIDEGSLEPMLATPRSPLLLLSLSKSIAPALGDVMQGLFNIIALFFIASPAMVLRCLFFTGVSGIAFFAVFLLCGSLSFFVSRGGALGQLLIECNLSLSFYPTGKVFADRGRLLLFLTPAALTAVLPMEAVETGSWTTALLSLAGAAILFWISVQVFKLGLKRYQSSSYVMTRA